MKALLRQAMEALEGLMELERRDRLIPIGREWDAARAALSALSSALEAGEEPKPFTLSTPIDSPLRRAASPVPADTQGDAKDAARYRWLRDHKAYVAVQPHYRELPKARRTGWTIRLVCGNDASFDAAIDAAMSATPEAGKK